MATVRRRTERADSPVSDERKKLGPPRDAAFVQVILTCGHKLTYPTPSPNRGDEVWCRYCSGGTRVLVVGAGEYKVDCQGTTDGRCTLHRYTGADLSAARHLASTHSTKRPTHVIHITFCGEVVEKVAMNPDQGKLPFTAALNELQSIGREQQKLLKGLRNDTGL